MRGSLGIERWRACASSMCSIMFRSIHHTRVPVGQESSPGLSTHNSWDAPPPRAVCLAREQT